jgi:allantoicase
VVDTAWFTGNYPPEVAVDGAVADGTDDPVDWTPLVPRSPVAGDTENAFAVEHPGRITHVRLRIFPDGGVARLRVHGEALPDPELLDLLGTTDLAALEHGGRVVGCSNAFYGSPNNLLMPGPARHMGEGWENARRRDDGNDWVEVAFVAEAALVLAELDTSWFLHNAPGWAGLTGRTADGGTVELLERTPLRPDTRHRFRVPATPVTHVRMDVHPDGGMARLRLHGALTPGGRAELAARWSGSSGKPHSGP